MVLHLFQVFPTLLKQADINGIFEQTIIRPKLFTRYSTKSSQIRQLLKVKFRQKSDVENKLQIKATCPIFRVTLKPANSIFRYDMAAPEMTDDMKNDLKLLKYRQVWESSTKAKKSDRRGNAPFFQVGTIMDSAEVIFDIFSKF